MRDPREGEESMKQLKTEMRNLKSMHIDKMTTAEMVAVINAENYNAVRAVEAESDAIARAIDAVSEGLRRGGRLIYMGAGTSGRIGVLDASECPPTYGVSSDTVIGIMAGGDKCLRQAAENAEDDEFAGVEELKKLNIDIHDTVIGLSVAGGARYVNSAVSYAKSVGAKTVGITSNADSVLAQIADIAICPDTGAEVITGSTRMKAGTAQKLILNTISTCAMVKCGYVYENLMINLRPTNIKLTERMVGIVMSITGCDDATARAALDATGWRIPEAVEYLK